MRAEFMILLVVIFVMATMMAVTAFTEQRQAEDCADAGGFYIAAMAGEACIDQDALIEDY